MTIKTKIVKLDPFNPQIEYCKEAAQVLRKGGLVIIPTETVYGIAADRNNIKAIERLSNIKNRPGEKHFSLHIDKKERIEEFSNDIPTAAYKLIAKFWPGPLTLVLKSKEKDNPTIGIRMPDNEIALKIIKLSELNVVCPSANISGRPAPVDFEGAIKDLFGLVDFAIDAGRTRIGIESSVADLSQAKFAVLREGAIKKEDIENTALKKTILFVCTGNSCRSVMAKGIMEKKLKEKKRDDIEVLSRGIMMLGGLGATEETKEVLKDQNIDVSSHRSERVTKDVIKESDLILVMERLHEEKVLELVPQAKNRVFLLKEFAKINVNDDSLEVADPIGKSPAFYQKTFDTIKEAIERIIEVI